MKTKCVTSYHMLSALNRAWLNKLIATYQTTDSRLEGNRRVTVYSLK